MLRKAIALLLTVVLVMGLTIPAAAAGFGDTAGHWAEKAIDRWSGEGILNGYEDGSFRPDGDITRAELAAVLYRVMNYITQAENTFPDVEQAEWYAEAVLSANAAGVLKGDEEGLRPNDKITRQEAIVMLGRALGVAEDPTGASVYSDAADIADWAKGLVGGMTKAGFIQGSGGRISPNAKITRAEAVTVLDNAISAIYSKAGTYSADAEKDVIVSVPGVVLKDMTIKGDLILAEGIGGGNVELDNVTVKGSTIVRGGGENSIIIKGGSALTNIVIERRDGKVRVSVEGDANVEIIVVNDGSDDVKIEGTVGTVVVENSAAPVEITGTVKNLQIAENAAGAKVSVSETAKVENVSIAAPEAKLEVAGEVSKVEVEKTAEASNITGGGTVGSVAANADNVKVDTPNTKVEAGEGTSGVTAGDKEIPGGTTETTPDKKPETPPVVGPVLSTWDGTSVDDSWYNDTSDSFTLTSAAQLAGLAKLVNEGTDFAGKTVNLGINIDLNNKTWTPIGDGNRESLESSDKFSGTFDGGSYTVSNLTNNSDYVPTTVDGNEYSYGLFGVAKNAIFKNLTITNANINTNTSTLLGDSVGALVGFSSGNLTVENCSVTNSVISGNDAIAALVGRAYGTAELNEKVAFINCASSSTVESNAKAGGMTAIISGGIESAELENCSNSGSISGNISGGICGYISAPSKVTDCENTGAVTASAASNAGYAGGVIGTLFNESNGSQLTACTNSGTVNGAAITGGIIGYGNENLSGVSLANCNNTADIASTGGVAGGISGTFVGSMTDCSNSGNVSGKGAAGGVVGQVSPQSSNTTQTVFNNCAGGKGTITAAKSTSGNPAETDPFKEFAFSAQLLGIANGDVSVNVAAEGVTSRPTVAAMISAGSHLTVTGGTLYGLPANRADRTPTITIEAGAVLLIPNGTPPFSGVINGAGTVIVNDEAGLKKALTDGLANIKLGDNISGVSQTLAVTQDVVLDLNGKTITSDGVITRVFKLSSGNFTIKNGVIDAKGTYVKPGSNAEAGTGAYGAVIVNGGSLTVLDTTLKNYRPWGLNIKLTGGEATLTNVKIDSQYGGGIEVSGGATANLNNCTIAQTNYNDWCSTAVSVSGMGTANINGGTYSSEGGYALYVFSSGGTINVKDGTFSGTSELLRCDVDKSNYPDAVSAITIEGGNFTGPILTSQPTPEYIKFQPKGGVFNVSDDASLKNVLDAVATTESSAAVTVKLGADIALTKPVTISRNVTIDGSGKTITSNCTAAQKAGLISILGEGTKVSMKDLTILDGSGKKNTAVRLGGTANELTMTGCNIDVGYYAILVGDEGSVQKHDDCKINLTNCNLTGYAAVYFRTNALENTGLTINRPVLNVTGGSLVGRGISGESNEFSAIVFNGTRGARATIAGCTLSNIFNSTNAEATEGIISFNCWGAYEKDAVVTITNSTIKTNNNTYSPNVIKYTCCENLDVGNKVTIDNLTSIKGEDDSDLIRVMRNGNELVATGIDLKTVLGITVYSYEKDPPIKSSLVVGAGDNVIIPVPTAIAEDTVIPAGVTVTVNAAITGEGTLTGETGAVLIINAGGSYGSLEAGTYTWTGAAWAK